MRCGCLHVPELPLAAVLRAHPELHGTAFAVADAPGPRSRLIAVSPAARHVGVEVGLSAAQAQARAAGLTILPRCADLERAAQAALGDVAESLAPRVEEAGEGLVYFDAVGLGSLFGSENELAQAAARRAEVVGLPAQVGIAASRAAAYLAARDGGGVTVLPSGEEWSFLAPVAIDLLGPSPVLQATLRRWGIHTIGALAGLPAAAVATRLGAEGVRLVALARGDDSVPLQSRPPVTSFEEGVELDYGVDSLEPLAFVLRGLLERLLARLQVRGLVCGDLRLRLRLANRARDERTVVVAAPSNDGKSLLALLRVHLELHPATAAVEGVVLQALPERLRPAQLDLFRPSGPAPARLATTLARLTALCGADRVGAPAVIEAHRPDLYGVEPFAVGEASGETWARPASPALPSVLALRAVRPPREIEVLCQRDRPHLVRGENLSGRVVHAAGPWRHQGSWWNEAHYARDYYDTQLSDGGVYRIFRDLHSSKWFLEGSYD